MIGTQIAYFVRWCRRCKQDRIHRIHTKIQDAEYIDTVVCAGCGLSEPRRA